MLHYQCAKTIFDALPQSTPSFKREKLLFFYFWQLKCMQKNTPKKKKKKWVFNKVEFNSREKILNMINWGKCGFAWRMKWLYSLQTHSMNDVNHFPEQRYTLSSRAKGSKHLYFLPYHVCAIFENIWMSLQITTNPPPPPPPAPLPFFSGGGGQGGGQVCSINHALTGKGLTFLPSLPVLIFLLLNYVNINFVLYTVLLEITGVGAITISTTQPTPLRLISNSIKNKFNKIASLSPPVSLF